MYADDLALVATGKDPRRIRELQQLDTTTIGNWCRRNQLTVNMDKTKVLWIYPLNSNVNLQGLNMMLNGQSLKVVDQFNYLSLLIDLIATPRQCASVGNH